MKVYMSGQLRYEGCYYYRCLLPLQENGWDGDKVTRTGRIKEPAIAGMAMRDADIIVFQRPFEKERFTLFEAMRSLGKKIVFDNDDTYKVNDVMKLGKYLDKINENIDFFVKNSDLVTCTTEFLADEYRKLNKNVVVIPNMINPDHFPKRKSNLSKKIRIGLVGSIAHCGDTEHIKPLLKELSDRSDIQLVLFALNGDKAYQDDMDFWSSLNIEWQPFVHMENYYETLNNLKLDLMLIPRLNNYFNRCKSNIKFLEASMLQIPVVAQTWNDGQSPYDKDGEYMVMANTLEEWRKMTNSLIEDKEWRKMVGRRAKKYVLDNYDITKYGKVYKDIYSTIL